MDVNTGIPEQARKEISEGLSSLLADTYTLYLKTQGYHWNVTGSMFRNLHLMFEEEYIDLRDAADLLAERILALGHVAPASYAEFSRLSSVPDEEGVPEAIRTARQVVAKAEEASDVATADLVTSRIEVHEKTAWMLRATVA
jgi:starvation-inducible DNA-binding protein